jgi:hypothetical protein
VSATADTTAPSQEIIGAWRTGGYIAVDAGYSATRDAGTPALPMDMIKDDAWRFGLTQKKPSIGEPSKPALCA